jgi:environmental stress-induced protein Ves
MIHLRKENYLESEWAGGTTRQFYIFPEDSSVEKRDFLFRVSSAKINLDQSDFSAFEGYSRLLLTLDHSIQIQHNEKSEKKIRPFEIEAFDGALKTTSKGKCTDFNLIFRPERHGEIAVHHLKESKEFVFSRQPYEKFALLFLQKGRLELEGQTIDCGDCLVLEEEDYDVLELLAKNECNLILARIS